jgi:hypothetical protein
MNNQNQIPECIFTEGSWLNFRDEVKKVDPELFDIIEKISPTKKYKLFKGEYLYGEKITDFGTICLPDEAGKLFRLDSPKISDYLKNQLSYSVTPLILQLGNGAEVFVEALDRIIPLNVFKPGNLYGLFEVVGLLSNCVVRPCWNVTSGARSVFFAAKISDAIGHRRLFVEYQTPEKPPKRLIDQWETFKAINRSVAPDKLWRSSVIIFGRDWFSGDKNDVNWLRFHKYLFAKAWQQTAGIRMDLEYDSLLWEHFSDYICKRNLKPNSYLIDTIKHLLKIANGTAAGFKLINNDEVLFPTKIVERAYSKIYDLKYPPLILGPVFQNPGIKNAAIYYSLSYPTLREGTPAIRYTPSIISELRDVRRLLNALKEVLQSSKGVSFYDTVKNFEFKYFHDGKEEFEHILNSSEIPNHDKNIMILLESFRRKKFPFHGPFFRGCVQITVSNHN